MKQVNTAYCIECEHSVLVEGEDGNEHHMYPVYDEWGRLDYDWCFFTLGWATVEPEFNPNWDDGLVEPDAEEMAKIDADALLLVG